MYTHKVWKHVKTPLCVRVQGIIHYTQKVERAQVSMGKWMDKNIACAYSGMFFSIKRKDILIYAATHNV